MQFKISSLLLFLFFFPSNIFSQNIIIENENPEAPNEELIIYQYNQAFFDYKIPVSKLITGDMNGAEVKLSETTCLYIDYGPYQAYFYAEPGKNYLIKLPETHDISDDWKRNPYFQASKYHLETFETGTNNIPSELNEKIRIFDNQFDPFADEQILRYYNTGFEQEKFDSFLIAQIIPDTLLSDDYYQSYIYYKRGILEFSLKALNLDKLTEKYFTNKNIHFENPAYRELFSQMFQSYFNYLEDKEIYSETFYYLATKNYTEISDYLSDIELFNQEAIYSNILLNEIYKAYYSINFNKKKLLEILSTIIHSTSDPNILKTSKELEKSFIFLEASYPVPEFNLTNLKGEEIGIADLKGKYVYLGFCNLKSISCMRELEYIKYLYSRFSKDLEILYCIIEEEKTEIESFVEWHNIQWEVFPINQNDKILNDYKVMAFPVFYLINKDGTLLKNPAPNPSENFEYLFTEILRSEKNL